MTNDYWLNQLWDSNLFKKNWDGTGKQRPDERLEVSSLTWNTAKKESLVNAHYNSKLLWKRLHLKVVKVL